MCHYGNRACADASDGPHECRTPAAVVVRADGSMLVPCHMPGCPNRVDPTSARHGRFCSAACVEECYGRDV